MGLRRHHKVSRRPASPLNAKFLLRNRDLRTLRPDLLFFVAGIGLGLALGRGQALQTLEQLFLGHAVGGDVGVVGIGAGWMREEFQAIGAPDFDKRGPKQQDREAVYYLAPDAEQFWPWIVPGSRFATLLWLLISLGFRFYVIHFGQYNQMYGTIGAVIVVLLWFYLSGLVLLVGAELNSELEHASPYGKNEGEKVPGQHRRWLFRTRRHGGIGETPESDHA